jgi:hypothetical protein
LGVGTNYNETVGENGRVGKAMQIEGLRTPKISNYSRKAMRCDVLRGCVGAPFAWPWSSPKQWRAAYSRGGMQSVNSVSKVNTHRKPTARGRRVGFRAHKDVVRPL